MKKLLSISTLCALWAASLVMYSCTNEPKVLDAPTSTDVTAITQTGAKLSWSPVAGAGAYDVKLGDISISVTTSSYTPGNLTPGTSYTWQVRATDGDLVSDWTTGKQFSTDSESGALAAPTNLDVKDITSEGATFTWDAVEGATGYKLKVGESPYYTKTTSYTVIDLYPEMEYEWEVCAVNTTETGPWAEGETFSTSTPINYSVAAPTNPEISAVNNNGATFSWTASTDPEADGYQLLVGTKIYVSGANDPTSRTVSDLASGKEYSWKVRATKGKGVSPWVTEDDGKFTTSGVAVAPPTALAHADVTHNAASLSWTAAVGADAHQVKIVALHPEIEDQHHHKHEGTHDSHYAEGLAPEIDHEWYVRAIHGNNASEWVAGSTFTTLAAGEFALAPPTALDYIDINVDRATLIWKASATRGVDYEVRIDGVVRPKISVTTYLLTGLEDEQIYDWAVRAVRDGESSEWVEGESIETTQKPVGIPSELAVDGITFQGATFTWSEALNARSYDIELNGEVFPVAVDPETGLPVTTYTASLIASTDYTWRVRGVRTTKNAGEWVEGPAFRTNDMNVPSGLVVSDITHKGASFNWSASEDATGYQIQIGNLSPVDVTGTTYTTATLNDATSYTWKVRATNGESVSQWVEAAAFMTRTLLLMPAVAGYYGDYYAPDTENFEIYFIDFDPAGNDWSGIELDLDLITGPIDKDPSKEFLDLPEGTYNFSSTPAANTFVSGYILTINQSGNVTGQLNLTGGSMTITGNHTNYTIAFDLTYSGGELHADYFGAWEIPNPDYLDPEYLSRLGGYTANGTPAYFIDGESPTWSGELFDIGSASYYGVSNGFNSGNDHAIDVKGKEMFFNDKLSLGTATLTNGTRVTVYGIGAVIDPSTGDMLGVLNQGANIPLEWNPSTRTITFPAEMNITGFGMMPMMFGLGGRNSAGAVAAFFSELYKDLVLTLDPLPEAAGAPAHKYLRKVPVGMASNKVRPAVQTAPMPALNMESMSVELNRSGYHSYKSAFDK